MVKAMTVESGKVQEEISVGDRFVQCKAGDRVGKEVEVKGFSGDGRFGYVTYHLEGVRSNRVETAAEVAEMVGGRGSIKGYRWIRKGS